MNVDDGGFGETGRDREHRERPMSEGEGNKVSFCQDKCDVSLLCVLAFSRSVN